MAQVSLCCLWSCTSSNSGTATYVHLMPDEHSEKEKFGRWKEAIVKHHKSLIYSLKGIDENIIEIPKSLLLPQNSPLFVCSKHFSSGGGNVFSDGPVLFEEEVMDKSKAVESIDKHFKALHNMYPEVAKQSEFCQILKTLKIDVTEADDPNDPWKIWDPKTKNILYYIQKGSLPFNLSLSLQEKKALIDEAIRYYIEDGMLYYGRRLKVITSRDQRDEVFKDLKIEKGKCDESAVQALIDDVKSKYHWPTLEQDVKQEVSRVNSEATESNVEATSDGELVLDESEGTLKKAPPKTLEQVFEAARADITTTQKDSIQELSSCLALVNRLMMDEDNENNQSISGGSKTPSKVVNESAAGQPSLHTKQSTQHESIVINRQDIASSHQSDVAKYRQILPRPGDRTNMASAIVNGHPTQKSGNATPIDAKPQFRPVASLLFDIGRSLVREQVYKNLIDDYVTEELVENKLLHEKQLGQLQENYKSLKKKNSYLCSGNFRCSCGHMASSSHALELHQDYGDFKDPTRFECCICQSTGNSFSTKFQALFNTHMLKMHNRVTRQHTTFAFFTCPFCPFEHRHNTKAKHQRHIDLCRMSFMLDRNLIPSTIDSDIPLYQPTVIATVPPKPVMVSKPSLPVSTAANITSCAVVTSANTSTSLTTGATPITTSINKVTMPSKPTVIKVQSQALLVCEICGGFVNDHSSLMRHMTVAHKVILPASFAALNPQPHLPCPQCTERYWTPVGLQTHIERFHSADKPATLSSRQRCALCCRTRIEDPITHLAINHRITTRDMFLYRFCAICAVELHSVRAFEDHMILLHNKYFPDRASIHKYIPDIMSNDNNKPLYRASAYSTKSTGNKRILPIVNAVLQHSKAGTEVRIQPMVEAKNTTCCPLCNLEHGVDEVWKHFEVFHTKRCGHCNKKFVISENLDEHVRTVHMSREIICTVCNVKVSAGSAYTQHFMEKHLQQCSVSLNTVSDEGSLSFSNKENLSDALNDNTSACSGNENTSLNISDVQSRKAVSIDIQSSSISHHPSGTTIADENGRPTACIVIEPDRGDIQPDARDSKISETEYSCDVVVENLESDGEVDKLDSGISERSDATINKLDIAEEWDTALEKLDSGVSTTIKLLDSDKSATKEKLDSHKSTTIDRLDSSNKSSTVDKLDGNDKSTNEVIIVADRAENISKSNKVINVVNCESRNNTSVDLLQCSDDVIVLDDDDDDDDNCEPSVKQRRC